MRTSCGCGNCSDYDDSDDSDNMTEQIKRAAKQAAKEGTSVVDYVTNLAEYIKQAKEESSDGTLEFEDPLTKLPFIMSQERVNKLLDSLEAENEVIHSVDKLEGGYYPWVLRGPGIVGEARFGDRNTAFSVAYILDLLELRLRAQERQPASRAAMYAQLIDE